MLTADIKDYAERILAGKIKESNILTQLRKHGIKLADATLDDDTDKKIDAWILYEDDSRHSLQVKQRENGDDIIFEIMKDLDKNIVGRDSVSKAEFYLVVDREGNGRLFATAQIKKLAQQLLSITKNLANSGRTQWRGIGWELKITIDKAHGNRKLMGYFNPGKFDCIGEWKFEL